MPTPPPMVAEGLHAEPIVGEPLRIVVIRFHAFGDTAIALPAVSAIADRWPRARIEVVTDPRSAGLFAAWQDVDRVWPLDRYVPRPQRVVRLLQLAAALRVDEIDVVLDWQNNRSSRILRRLSGAAAWAGFDRFAPRHHLDRELDSIAAAGLGELAPVHARRIRHPVDGAVDELLDGLAGPLGVLNPAGGYPTRNWPLDRWVSVGRELTRTHGIRWLVLGTGPMIGRVRQLRDALPGVVDLTERTTPSTALGVIARCKLMISEDGGLMHLAWVQGVPTIGLLGSSRATWGRPLGPHARWFGSEDLPCGPCHAPACARGDLHCLDRVGVADVVAAASGLLSG
jgi:heptosyltransferase-2